eukprot:1137776-Pelagomonas_calceolata.AAC.3
MPLENSDHQLFKSLFSSLTNEAARAVEGERACLSSVRGACWLAVTGTGWPNCTSPDSSEHEHSGKLLFTSATSEMGPLQALEVPSAAAQAVPCTTLSSAH